MIRSIYHVRRQGEPERLIERTGRRASEELAGILVSRYLHKSNWYKKIVSRPDYATGGDEIKVYCDNGDYVVFYTNEKEEEEK